jgi:argininosuccinate lyase
MTASNGDTGRIRGVLGPRTRQVIYGDLSPADLRAELPLMITVDRAHLVMLAEQHLISPATAAELLRSLDKLAASGYAPLYSRPAPRGIYLMYEGYLISQLGPDIGGVLQSGRSRNDLKATLTLLRLRDRLLEFATQATRLEAVLLSAARRHRDVIMPVYTHFQAALPTTYGHYLLGVALALGRDLDALRTASAGLRVCPLGAGAATGTDLPINPARTASLLGFDTPARHALDAVASRDVALNILAAAASLVVLLSRLAVDLQLWSTTEFGFLTFPDRLVGSSSAMPQKRNAFLLEHLKAKPAHVIGAWTAAASAMSATPFTNSIEVGTEAIAALWPGLTAARDAVLLAQVLVTGAHPNPDRMADRTVTGFTTATALANHLVRTGTPFRTAHHEVGTAVRHALEAGSTNLTDFAPPGRLPALSPTTVVHTQTHGGGPGDFDTPHTHATTTYRTHHHWLHTWRQTLTQAEAELSSATTTLCAPEPR